MKLGTYIMAPEPILTKYLITGPHQFMCLYMYPSVVATQRLCKSVTAATNIRVVFYAIRFVSKESRLLVLPRTSCYFLLIFLGCFLLLISMVDVWWWID
jgi:hypothetical protein